MNRYQRKNIRNLIEYLEEIKDNLVVIFNVEQDKIDNIPENLQMSKRSVKMYEACDNLGYAGCSLEECITYLENSIGC